MTSEKIVSIDASIQFDIESQQSESRNNNNNRQEFSSSVLIEDEERIRKLIEIGKEKGFVSYGDFEKILGNEEAEVIQIDEQLMDAAFSELINAGVEYKESENKSKEISESPTKLTQVELDQKFLEKVNVNDGITLYIHEIGKVPLLTIQEEVKLSKRIEKGKNSRAKFASESQTPERTSELLDVIKDGWAAREHLITANTRLVISVAKKLRGRGVPLADLIQDGNIGLMRSTKKFDYRRGYKFSTYATWWIRQAVGRSIADQGRTIRLPVHMGDKINSMLRASEFLTQKLGRSPAVEELAAYIDQPLKKVEDMMRASMRPISTERPTDEDGNSVLGDFIPDEDAELPFDEITKNLLHDHMREILEQLTAKQVRVLSLRFGLEDTKEHTLKEIGQKLGVTRERVRQIEADALRKLRARGNKKVLADYLRG